MIIVRSTTPEDHPVVATLLEACMVELFDRRWSGTVAQLTADVAAGRITIALAVSGDRPVGFLAWSVDYDLHHCVTGGTTCELYVEPAVRGRAVAAMLIAFVCKRIAETGGVFLKGTAVRTAAPLYDRVAWGWDCREVILGGGAFRTLADLAGASAREIVRGLPDPAWNHE